ncbi:GumC family protein [Penaeicola halotolerans]|uniref:GumC family protein n=1 Tax=Penaeicola halotolerans TaxID=2793196 RepID=UPI001CF919B8|nr:tyrosine-protein kinase [Penaeicola halotolerans]
MSNKEYTYPQVPYPMPNDVMPPEEESIDIKGIIFRFLKYWPFFLLSIVASLAIVWFYHRYTAPKYTVSGTLMIKEEFANGGIASGFIEGTELFNNTRNIENEIFIIRSKSLAAQALDKVDFDVTYFSEGTIKRNELYQDAPFEVEVDWTHAQLTRGEFRIEPINDNQFRLREGEKSFSNYGGLDSVNQLSPTNVNLYETTFNYGEWIENRQVRFRITKRGNIEDDRFLFTLNDRESLIELYSRSVGVKQVGTSGSILELSIETSVIPKGRDYLNTLMETYIQNELNDKNQVAANTIRFIDSQLGGITDSLTRVEQTLEDFRVNNKTINLSSEGQAIFGRLIQIEEQRFQEKTKNEYYRTLLKYIQNTEDLSKVFAPSVVNVNDELLNSLVTKLVELNNERINLGMNTLRKNSAIEEKETQIQATVQTLTENLNNLITNSEIELQKIAQRITEVEKQLLKVPPTERKLVNIERQFNLNEGLYLYLLQKRAEAGIARASNVASNKVVDYAKNGLLIFPKKEVNYLIALALGLVLPIILIFLKEFFNTRIEDQKELEKYIQIPILGIVGHSSKRGNLVVLDNPKSLVAESFRSLRTNLNYISADKKSKTILVTSSVSGEGKTFTSINLASIFALGGKKTILVGLDLRKPRIFTDFGLENSVGMTNYLINQAKKEDIILKSNYDNLDLIASGPVPPNPAELLLNGKLEVLLEDLKNTYDIIILDTPPMGLVSETLDLMKYSDVNLYMVRQHYTLRGQLGLVNELYEKGSIRNIYALFNDYSQNAGSYAYNYGYGYGYKYGYTYGSQYSGGYYSDDEDAKTPWYKKIFRV